MKILSWNVNGLRSVTQKGFWTWMDEQNPDVVCLQETKITRKDFLPWAQAHGVQLLDEASEAPSLLNDNSAPPRWWAVLACADKAGYSGVLTLLKQKPLGYQVGLQDPLYDQEGRTVIVNLGGCHLINTYVPNAQRDLGRTDYKLAYSDRLHQVCQDLQKHTPHVLLCGDFNVAHQEIDIKNPKTNTKNAGFTPREREWMTQFLHQGFVDVWRQHHPLDRDVYTWWSYRPGVREKNIGWRIDYFLASTSMAPSIKNSWIAMNQLGSDHCPLGVEWTGV